MIYYYIVYMILKDYRISFHFTQFQRILLTGECYFKMKMMIIKVLYFNNDNNNTYSYYNIV